MATRQAIPRHLREGDPDRYLFPTEKVELIKQGYDYRFDSIYKRLEQEDFTGPKPAHDDSLVRLDCLSLKMLEE